MSINPETNYCFIITREMLNSTGDMNGWWPLQWGGHYSPQNKTYIHRYVLIMDEDLPVTPAPPLISRRNGCCLGSHSSPCNTRRLAAALFMRAQSGQVHGTDHVCIFTPRDPEPQTTSCSCGQTPFVQLFVFGLCMKETETMEHSPLRWHMLICITIEPFTLESVC